MYQVYMVTEGDNLDSLSSKFLTSKEELIRINGLVSDNLLPGSVLVVPNNNSIYYTYIVKTGDNLYNIANMYGQDIDVLYALNGIKKGDYIYPNQQILIPKENVSVYITNSNDSLNSVSEKLGISVSDLIDENSDLFLLPDQVIVYSES